MTGVTNLENKGFVKGTTVQMKNCGHHVIILGEPKLYEPDGKIRVWVAMLFDTYVRYLAAVDDLELL